jgi:IS5 family transposase
MNQLLPWQVLCKVVGPYCPLAGRGCPPVGLERMLCMHFVQHGHHLAHQACEEALLDTSALRRFVSTDRDLGGERVPNGTAPPTFHHLLEVNKLGEGLFAKLGKVPQAHDLKVGTGTIVDATPHRRTQPDEECREDA